MSKIAYVRVSTQEQNEARQREALSARGIDKWFIEKTSAKDTDRPEYQKMMDWVREGDTISISTTFHGLPVPPWTYSIC